MGVIFVALAACTASAGSTSRGATLITAAASVATTASAAPSSPVAPASACAGPCVWLATYDGPASGNDAAEAVALSPDGSTLYVTGDSAQGGTPGSRNGIATIAYAAATGEVEWRATEEPNAGAAVGAIEASAKRVFIAGNNAGDAFIAAYDAATGRRDWRAVEDRGFIQHIAVDGAGRRVFALQRDAGRHPGISIYGFDAAAGRLEWRADVGDGSTGQGIVTTPSGDEVVAVGGTEGQGFTAAFDGDSGAPLWEQHIGPNATSSAVATSPNGAVVFSAGSSFRGSRYQAITTAYSASSGSTRWETETPFGHGVGYQVVSGRHDRVISGGARGFDPLSGSEVVGYDANDGAREWTSIQHAMTPAPLDAASLAVGPGGKDVYVVGRLHQRMAVVAYHGSTGRLRWLRISREGKVSGAVAVVVGPDGTVFVTGWMHTHENRNSNFLTIAYAR